MQVEQLPVERQRQQPLRSEEIPGHLIGLPGEEWAFWKWACLRGAGFPARLVERLATADCAEAADEVLKAELSIVGGREEAIAALEAEIADTSEKQKWRRLVKAVKQLKRGQIPEYEEGPASQAIQAFAAKVASREGAIAEFKKVFHVSVQEVGRRIREVSLDPLFQQAVTLQNRRAFDHVLQAFAKQEQGKPKRGFKERQNEEFIANYLQRYCLKNDTVGFFGPVGWAQLLPHAQGMISRAGPKLIATMSIYFENWCIEALADKIGEDPRLLPWIAPRLIPYYRLEANQLFLPSGQVVAIPVNQAALLQKCSGEKTAREIALELLESPGGFFSSETQVYDVLRQMSERRVLSWKFDLPYCLHPERRLRELLERIEPPHLRQAAIQPLDELERARDAVSRAVGDPVKLGEALTLLDETFTSLTGKKPTRSDGAMYAARTLIYQDCRRDVDVQIGLDVQKMVSAPLALVLTSARWFSYQASKVYRRFFDALYAELRRSPDGDIDLLRFWSETQARIFSDEDRLLTGVIKDFQERWRQVLQTPENERRAVYSAEELRSKVNHLFAAPSSGWRLARNHSPDLMIAASSPEAITEGDCFFVLGEIHLCYNTCRASFMVAQHPCPDELFDAIEGDLPEHSLMFVPSRNWPRYTNRTSVTLVPTNVLYLEGVTDPIANAPRSKVVPMSSMVVANTTEGLRVRSKDGRHSFDIIEAFGELLSMMFVEMMKMIHTDSHSPRITVDRLVIFRERWFLAASGLNFVDLEEECERYLEVRRWATKCGFPRRVFVSIPDETKPFYVDFDSHVYTEILVKMLRKVRAAAKDSGRVSITEMLGLSLPVLSPEMPGRDKPCPYIYSGFVRHSKPSCRLFDKRLPTTRDENVVTARRRTFATGLA
ncbi:MAG: lantibiotic dehydratase family protein [Acidobacteria bacterium]|nr:lantibiotic dehydratase family protein [Acidobacteriota bacterium]